MDICLILCSDKWSQWAVQERFSNGLGKTDSGISNNYYSAVSMVRNGVLIHLKTQSKQLESEITDISGSFEKN